ERGVVDHDVSRDRAALRGSSITEHQVRQGIGRVGLVSFVRTGSAASPKYSLCPRIDRGLQPTADLGSKTKVAFDHPVVRSPHPEPARRMLPRRARIGILRLRTGAHTRI